MEQRRFDDLTRKLGAATSRRQVLKGLLGGLAAAVVGRAAKPAGAAADGAEVCDRAKCEQEAYGLWKICNTNCRALSKRHGYNYREKEACSVACFAALQVDKYECAHNTTGCLGGIACCAQHCVVLETDAKNCGACGHTCPEGSRCIGGQCHCENDRTFCDEQCVDTRTDPKHCGDCDTKCGTCQTCQNGRCAAKHCPNGFVCCNDACVPLCSDGTLPDPMTCQCNVCKGQIDGAACDANDATKVCCQEQCVSNQCPAGKTFSLDICRCQCTNSCPPDQLQDPDTCECQDLCANVSCGACQTCDPTSGDCVPTSDGTVCGTGNICCQGSCVAGPTCSGVCQGLPQGSPCGPSGYCCVNDTTCHNPVDVIGYDNHCCLQYEVWCEILGTCTSGPDCCQAMGPGAYCGTTEHNEPICCSGADICCSGGYFFPGNSGVCAANNSSCR